MTIGMRSLLTYFHTLISRGTKMRTHDNTPASERLNVAIAYYSEDYVRKPKRDALSVVAMSMLDIIACGLGAVVLVAIMNMVILFPVSPILSNNFLYMEVRGAGAAHIAFELQHRDMIEPITISQSTDPVLLETSLPTENGEFSGRVTYVSGLQDPDCLHENKRDKCKAVASIFLDEPAIGVWTIRPLLSQQRADPNNPTLFSSPIKELRCHVWTEQSELISTDDEEVCKFDSGERALSVVDHVKPITIEILP